MCERSLEWERHYKQENPMIQIKHLIFKSSLVMSVLAATVSLGQPVASAAPVRGATEKKVKATGGPLSRQQVQQFTTGISKAKSEAEQKRLVYKTLDVTPAQQKQLNALQSATQTRMSKLQVALKKASPQQSEKIRQQMNATAKQSTNAAKAIFTPLQRAKLQQITAAFLAQRASAQQ
jgi:hypothetical protein